MQVVKSKGKERKRKGRETTVEGERERVDTQTELSVQHEEASNSTFRIDT